MNPMQLRSATNLNRMARIHEALNSTETAAGSFVPENIKMNILKNPKDVLQMKLRI